MRAKPGVHQVTPNPRQPRLLATGTRIQVRLKELEDTPILIQPGLWVNVAMGLQGIGRQFPICLLYTSDAADE